MNYKHVLWLNLLFVTAVFSMHGKRKFYVNYLREKSPQEKTEITRIYVSIDTLHGPQQVSENEKVQRSIGEKFLYVIISFCSNVDAVDD